MLRSVLRFVGGFCASFGALGIVLYAAFVFALPVLMVIGWVLNIIHVIALPSLDPFTVKLALMLIGIVFAPLGGLMGWIV